MDNHSKPEKRQRVNGQEEGKEDPLDSAIHTYGTINVQKWVDKMSPFVRVPVSGEHLRRGPGITSVRHLGRDVLVDGPA